MRPAPRRFVWRLPRPTPLTIVLTALAVLSAVLTHRLTAEADDARRRLGTFTPVLVATTDLDTGDPLDAASTTVEEWPEAYVPPGALTALDAGGVARGPIARGTPISHHDLALGASGPAARLPDGWRGVAVPIFDAAPPLAEGDLVDVHAAVDPLLVEDGAAVAGVVAERAIVIAVADDAITVGIPAERVDALPLALSNAVITLVLRR